MRQRRQGGVSLSAGPAHDGALEDSDPAAVDGTGDVIVRAFRYAFVVLNRRIRLFLSLPLSTLDQLAIKREVENISRS
jgi:arsenate reductase (thioredoxin)